MDVLKIQIKSSVTKDILTDTHKCQDAETMWAQKGFLLSQSLGMEWRLQRDGTLLSKVPPATSNLIFWKTEF